MSIAREMERKCCLDRCIIAGVDMTLVGNDAQAGCDKH